MKDYEKLMEHYEDALFELLMEDVVAQEGLAALEETERTKRDPDFEILPEVTKRNLALINRHFTRSDMVRFGRASGRILKKVVLAALICVLLFTTAFAGSPIFRENALNFSVEVLGMGTRIRFPEWSEYSMFNSPRLTVNWVPDEFSIIEKDASGPNAWIDYSDSAGNIIYVDCMYLSSYGKLNIDTEDAEVEYTEINGYTAMIVTKEIRNEVVLIDGARQMVVTVESETIPADILRQIAEAVDFSP